jgi:hypothetical protein
MIREKFKDLARRLYHNPVMRHPTTKWWAGNVWATLIGPLLAGLIAGLILIWYQSSQSTPRLKLSWQHVNGETVWHLKIQNQTQVPASALRIGLTFESPIEYNDQPPDLFYFEGRRLEGSVGLAGYSEPTLECPSFPARYDCELNFQLRKPIDSVPVASVHLASGEIEGP